MQSDAEYSVPIEIVLRETQRQRNEYCDQVALLRALIAELREEIKAHNDAPIGNVPATGDTN